jgi:uncharacterized protein YceH (UPF0502 family)
MDNELPKLSDVEIRGLGSLIDKSRTTPEYDPMTVNAISTACNQKTSRHPVVEDQEGEVMEALQHLKALSLVATAVGGTSRTTKYKHNFTTVFPVSVPELAIMCLLFLRGAQTPGELNTNSARLHTFISLQEVIESLHHLMHLEMPFVKELPRKPGQKEPRYSHLFAVNDAEEHFSAPGEEQPAVSLVSRVASLEKEVAELRATLDSVLKKVLEQGA